MSNFSPSPSSTVQRPDISLALAEHDLDRMRLGMIASEVLPIQEVAEFAANYGKLEAVELAQDHDIKRAAGAGYKRIDYKITQDSYETEEYGAEVVLDQRFMASFQYLAGGNMETFRMIAAQIAQEVLLLNYEKRVAALVQSATVFTANTSSVGTEWSNASSSTPSADVAAVKQLMRAKFGALGNQELVAIMSSKVRDNLRLADDITAKLQNVRIVDQLSISDADIAAALGVGRIIVGDSMRPTHAQGASASAFTDVWDDEFVTIAKLGNPMAEGKVTRPGLGRTFHWRVDGSLPLGLVESYFNDEVRAEVVRIRHQTDEKIEIVNAGHLLDNITA